MFKNRFILLLAFLVLICSVNAETIDTITASDNSISYKNMIITPMISNTTQYSKSNFDWVVNGTSFYPNPKVKIISPLSEFHWKSNYNETTECQSINQFYSECRKDYIDFSTFENKNIITKKVISLIESTGEWIYSFYGSILDLDPEFSHTITNSANLINATQVQGSIHGARLILNSTFEYNSTSGYFYSPVFMNITDTTQWSINFSMNERDNSSNITTIGGTNITLQTRGANEYNLTDPNLLSFWAMNNDPALGESTTVLKDLTGRNNGTIGAVNFAESNGTVGGGFSFSGVSPSNITIDTTNALSFAANANFTISFWVKPVSCGVYTRIIDIEANDFIIACNNNILNVYDGDWKPSTLSITNNIWNFITVVRDGSGTYKIYSNNQNSTAVQTIRAIDGKWYIGIRYSGGSALTGSIDEIRVYNSSLNYSQVYELYQLGGRHINWTGGEDNWFDSGLMTNYTSKTTSYSSKFMQFKPTFVTNGTTLSPYLVNYKVDYFSLDTIPPTIAAVGPNLTIEYYYDNNLEWWDVNATDASGLHITKPYFINYTTPWNISVEGRIQNNSFLDFGFYMINVSAQDFDGNNASTLMWINVTDTIHPILDIRVHDKVDDDREIEANTGRLCTYLNATDASGINTVKSEVNITYPNGTITLQAIGFDGFNASCAFAWDIVGTYNLTYYAEDNNANGNISILTFNITDTSAPSWDEMTYNVTAEFFNESVYADFNASDLSIPQTLQFYVNDTIRFRIDNTTGLLENITTLNVSIYYLNITINDSYNNKNNTIFWVNITDTIVPNVTLISPSNATSQISDTFTFGFNVTDYSNITNCTLYLNGVNNTLQHNTSNFTISLSDGTYNWEIYCYDVSFNLGRSANWTITNTAAVSGGGGGGGGGGAIAQTEGEERERLETTQCPQVTNFMDKLLSKCKLENGVCDPGENPIVDSDCNPTPEDIKSGKIIYYMWFVRIILLICIFLLLFDSPYASFFSIILIALFVVNGAFGFVNKEVSLFSPDFSNNLLNFYDYSKGLVVAFLLPHPFILAVISGFLFWYFGVYLPIIRHKRKNKQKQKRKVYK